MATGIQVVQLDGAAITPRHAWLRNSVELAVMLIGIPSFAYVLLNWNGPEWTSLDYLGQCKLLTERDPLNTYVGYSSNVWQASEFVVLLLNKRRRALHDFIAGTVVVRGSRGKTTQSV
jgi:uncharacterized RDD family membrane protein YckC